MAATAEAIRPDRRTPPALARPAEPGFVGPSEAVVAPGWLPALERDAIAIAHDPNPSAERLHRFHRDLRRIRVELQTLRHVLPRSDRPRVREVRGRLRRIARLVGEVRDVDVELMLLAHPRLARATRTSLEHFERTRGRLQEKARTGRALLGAFLRAELERGLPAELERAVALAQRRRSPRRIARATAIERERVRSRVDRALRRAHRRPSSRRLHRLRGALRHAHHLHDLSAGPSDRKDGSFPRRLERLQQALGRLHDLDVLADGLASLGSEIWNSDWARMERQRRQRLRREIRREIRRRSVRERVAQGLA